MAQDIAPAEEIPKDSSNHRESGPREEKGPFQQDVRPMRWASIIEQTYSLVSTSNRPGRGPANISLEDCSTLELFHDSVLLCNLPANTPIAVTEVTATYAWNDKQHLIRRDHLREWTLFCDAVCKAWEEEATSSTEGGCEIRMLVRVDFWTGGHNQEPGT